MSTQVLHTSGRVGTHKQACIQHNDDVGMTKKDGSTRRRERRAVGARGDDRAEMTVHGEICPHSFSQEKKDGKHDAGQKKVPWEELGRKYLIVVISSRPYFFLATYIRSTNALQ